MFCIIVVSQSQSVVDEAKYGSLLANLQERVVHTDQGMVVLSSQMSPNSTANTGQWLRVASPSHCVSCVLL